MAGLNSPPVIHPCLVSELILIYLHPTHYNRPGTCSENRAAAKHDRGMNQHVSLLRFCIGTEIRCDRSGP
jgi:hypothetical protein